MKRTETIFGLLLIALFIMSALVFQQCSNQKYVGKYIEVSGDTLRIDRYEIDFYGLDRIILENGVVVTPYKELNFVNKPKNNMEQTIEEIRSMAKFVIRKEEDGLWQIYKCGLFHSTRVLGKFFCADEALRAFQVNYSEEYDFTKIVIK